MTVQKITPFLWFDSEAEDAANFYVSIFGGKVLNVTKYMSDTPSHKEIGSVMTVDFEIAGLHFNAINGGPFFKFNEAISFVVKCESQEEVDKYWAVLSAYPSSEQCGWLKDKFGVSWQIIPKQLDELLSDSDTKKAQAVMQAMLQMKKLDMQKLQEASDAA